MTKKELQATMNLLAEIQGAIAGLKWYGKDFEAPTISTFGEALEASVRKFRKEAKI